MLCAHTKRPHTSTPNTNDYKLMHERIERLKIAAQAAILAAIRGGKLTTTA